MKYIGCLCQPKLRCNFSIRKKQSWYFGDVLASGFRTPNWQGFVCLVQPQYPKKLELCWACLNQIQGKEGWTKQTRTALQFGSFPSKMGHKIIEWRKILRHGIFCSGCTPYFINIQLSCEQNLRPLKHELSKPTWKQCCWLLLTSVFWVIGSELGHVRLGKLHAVCPAAVYSHVCSQWRPSKQTIPTNYDSCACICVHVRAQSFLHMHAHTHASTHALVVEYTHVNVSGTYPHIKKYMFACCCPKGPFAIGARS